MNPSVVKFLAALAIMLAITLAHIPLTRLQAFEVRSFFWPTTTTTFHVGMPVGAGEPDWNAAVGHRLTVELAEDTIDDAVYRRYLI